MVNSIVAVQVSDTTEVW